MLSFLNPNFNINCVLLAGSDSSIDTCYSPIDFLDDNKHQKKHVYQFIQVNMHGLKLRLKKRNFTFEVFFTLGSFRNSKRIGKAKIVARLMNLGKGFCSSESSITVDSMTDTFV